MVLPLTPASLAGYPALDWLRLSAIIKDGYPSKDDSMCNEGGGVLDISYMDCHSSKEDSCN